MVVSVEGMVVIVAEVVVVVVVVVSDVSSAYLETQKKTKRRYSPKTRREKRKQPESRLVGRWLTCSSDPRKQEGSWEGGEAHLQSLSGWSPPWTMSEGLCEMDLGMGCPHGDGVRNSCRLPVEALG